MIVDIDTIKASKKTKHTRIKHTNYDWLVIDLNNNDKLYVCEVCKRVWLHRSNNSRYYRLNNPKVRLI